MEKLFTPELVDAAWTAAQIANEAYGVDHDLHERAATMAAPMMGINTKPHSSFNGEPAKFHYTKMRENNMLLHESATIEDSPFASKAVHQQSQRVRAERQAESERTAEWVQFRNQHAETLFGFIADYVKDAKNETTMDATARQSLTARKDSIDALVERAKSSTHPYGYLKPFVESVTLERLGLVDGEPTSIKAIAAKHKISAARVKSYASSGKAALLTTYIDSL